MKDKKSKFLRLFMMGKGELFDQMCSIAENNKNIKFLGSSNSGAHNEIDINGNDISFDEIFKLRPDLIFVSEYRKIIKDERFFSILSINLHAGILPKYRGFNANSWAILNDENKVGFTYHRLTKNYDSGPIYISRKTKIGKKETYSAVRERMIEDLKKNFVKDIFKIYENQDEYLTQNGESRYCSKIIKSDGRIYFSRYRARYIYNMHRVMSLPLGTGIYFFYRGEKCVIDDIDYSEGNVYNGISGAVIHKTINNQIWVKTIDSFIIVKSILYKGEKIAPGEIIQINMRFE